jgi:hypothetical protein
MEKPALMDEMEKHGMELNEAGRTLFAHEGFTTTEVISTLATVEITVANLGFIQGATFGGLCE